MAPPDQSARRSSIVGLVPVPLQRLGRFLYAVGWRFLHDECLMRASGLAYVTLLSLVPLLALMFAVLKGLGVQRRLEPLLLSRFALDPDTADHIITYIDQINVGTLGALGAAALILTVVSVLGSVEVNLNRIWRVRRDRSYWRKLTDYSGVVLLTPMLLLAAVAITSFVQEQALLHMVLQSQLIGNAALQALRVLPILINAVALFIVYAVMTNRRPYWSGIAVGALVAGALWHAVQWGYVAFQIGIARYSAIYGAFSQVPVTLVWLYLSAAIVLAGAELAAVWEFGTHGTRRPSPPPSPWLIGVHLLVRAADRFQSHGGGLDVHAEAKQLRVDIDLVLLAAERLARAGYFAPVADQEWTYVLARDPRTIVLGTLDAGSDPGVIPPAGSDARVRSLAAQLAAQGRAARTKLRLSDVLSNTTIGTPSIESDTGDPRQAREPRT